jgi:hypothetical protein
MLSTFVASDGICHARGSRLGAHDGTSLRTVRVFERFERFVDGSTVGTGLHMRASGDLLFIKTKTNFVEGCRNVLEYVVLCNPVRIHSSGAVVVERCLGRCGAGDPRIRQSNGKSKLGRGADASRLVSSGGCLT